MSFTYNFDTSPNVAYVRLLISDTQSPGIFSDEEINAFYQIQGSAWQTSMFYSYPAGRQLPSQPTSYLRTAALALDSLASNYSRLASVTKLLDVQLSPAVAAKSLRDQAAEYREIDDNSGAFAVIEQCSTSWAFSDRFWKQVQRQSGTGIGGGLGG